MTTVASTRRHRWRRAVRGEGPGATVGLLGALVVVVALVDPHTPGRYPLCPWHALTGLWCPGCGGLRAVHDLTHGHLVTALHENLLAVLLAPSLLVWWLVLRRRHGGTRHALVLSSRGTVLVVALLVVFAIVRNLPIGAGLAP
jgi:Protein of unknown function (DUF2752)